MNQVDCPYCRTEIPIGEGFTLPGQVRCCRLFNVAFRRVEGNLVMTLREVDEAPKAAPVLPGTHLFMARMAWQRGDYDEAWRSVGAAILRAATSKPRWQRVMPAELAPQWARLRELLEKRPGGSREVEEMIHITAELLVYWESLPARAAGGESAAQTG